MPSFPWLIHVGSITVSAHGVFESAGYALGFGLYQTMRSRQGDVVAGTQRSSVIVAAMLGALIGSKLLFLLEDPALTLRSLTDFAYLMGGKTIVGGLLGGTMAVEWMKRRMGVTARTGDLFTLPLILGMMIGRVGCFVSGLEDHTYGVATSLPWGVDFGDGIARHPVQLYEVVFLGLLGLALHRMRGSLPNGGQFRMFLLTYCAWRLAIDFLKPGVPIVGLTAIQWACVAAVGWYSRNLAEWLGVREELHG